MQFDAEALLAQYVQAERTRRGWSQQQLADRLRPFGMDVHATGITRLERGERSIRLNDFIAICQAFEETWADVFAYMSTTYEFGSAMRAQLKRQEEAPPTLEETAEVVQTIVGTAHQMISQALERHRQMENPHAAPQAAQDAALADFVQSSMEGANDGEH